MVTTAPFPSTTDTPRTKRSRHSLPASPSPLKRPYPLHAPPSPSPPPSLTPLGALHPPSPTATATAALTHLRTTHPHLAAFVDSTWHPWATARVLDALLLACLSGSRRAFAALVDLNARAPRYAAFVADAARAAPLPSVGIEACSYSASRDAVGVRAWVEARWPKCGSLVGFVLGNVFGGGLGREQVRVTVYGGPGVARRLCADWCEEYGVEGDLAVVVVTGMVSGGAFLIPAMVQ